MFIVTVTYNVAASYSYNNCNLSDKGLDYISLNFSWKLYKIVDCNQITLEMLI